MKSQKIRDFLDSAYSGDEKSKKASRAEQLVSRGITDDNLVIEILKNETPVPEKLPAEMYDKVNYMCRRWMDRIARFELDYDFVPNVRVLKNIIICLLESAPVFHSSFVDNHINPCWKVSDYNIDDVFSVKETENLQNSADKFLLQDIDVKSNVQIKICLFLCGGTGKLCFIFNHMCMDGGGLKLFLKNLFSNYDLYMSTGSVSLFHSGASRAYERVYDDFSPDERKKAKMQFAGVSARDRHTLPFSDENNNNRKMLVRKRIDKSVFVPARLKAKEYGATVNDLISAAYIRAAYQMTNCKPNERIGISCAVDLRRHIKHPEKLGYTNHTAFMPCVLESVGETMSDTLKAVAESTKKSKEDKFVGLHGLPLLNIAYSSMIYAQAETVVGLFYNNANLAVSNVGKIEPEMFAISGIAPTAVWVAGGAKNKPCATMNALSYNDDLTLSICINGSESDRKMLGDFLDSIERNIILVSNG